MDYVNWGGKFIFTVGKPVWWARVLDWTEVRKWARHQYSPYSASLLQAQYGQMPNSPVVTSSPWGLRHSNCEPNWILPFLGYFCLSFFYFYSQQERKIIVCLNFVYNWNSRNSRWKSLAINILDTWWKFATLFLHCSIVFKLKDPFLSTGVKFIWIFFFYTLVKSGPQELRKAKFATCKICGAFAYVVYDFLKLVHRKFFSG